MLVTGATSGLGRNAALWLQQQGCQVIGIGRNPEAGRQLEQQGIQFVACDLATGDASQVHDLLKTVPAVDWVWHCAALSSPWGSWDSFYRINVLATRHLADAASAAGIKRFIHISTPSLYFDFRHHRDVDESFRARSFANHYVRSKALAETEIGRAQRHSNTLFIVLRPRAIFGAFDRVILPRLLERVAHSGGVLKLPRAGRALMDLTFAPNVVHAMLLASTHADLPRGAAYNITNQEPVHLGDVLDSLLREELGLSFEVKSVPYAVLHAAAFFMEKAAHWTGRTPVLTRYGAGALNFDMTLSTQKAQAELGYQAPYSMQDAIALTAGWLKQQPGFRAGKIDGQDHPF